MATILAGTERRSTVRRGQRLSWVTLGYNSLEGIIAVGAGLLAGSIALVGFGVDSLIEVTASVAALWRLNSDVDPIERERAELVTLRIVGVLFIALLARAKRKVAVALNSRALRSEAQQTQLCTYLSAILLGGLALNAVFGWWWADPVAALVMVPIIGKEGIEALRGHDCCEDGCA